MIRKLTLLLVVAIAIQSCHGVSIKDKLKEVGNDLKNKVVNTGKQVGDVVVALKDVAVDQTKNLLNQAIGALVGAFANTFKGTGLADLIGKREVFDVKSALGELMKNAHQTLTHVFNKTWEIFHGVVQKLVSNESFVAEKVKDGLKQAAEIHSLAVRGVLSDTFNTGIDLIKSKIKALKDRVSQWKDKLLGGDVPKTSDPVMLSRRHVFSDLFNTIGDHVKKIGDALKPHIDTVTSITTDIASALSHHVGQLLKSKTQDLVDSFSQHLSKAKDSLAKFKDDLSNKLKGVVSPADF